MVMSDIRTTEVLRIKSIDSPVNVGYDRIMTCFGRADLSVSGED